MKKIAFFDLDGTVTSEIDGSIPQSTIDSIRKARANGNLMFVNSGRSYENIEQRFRDIGWDGYICGCGTHIICQNKDLFYRPLSSEIVNEITQSARNAKLDLLFESKHCIYFDTKNPLRHPEAIQIYEGLKKGSYNMPSDITSPDFSADKFCVWINEDSNLEQF